MTFNTPGYVIQGGQIQTNSGGLTVTTNVDPRSARRYLAPAWVIPW